MGGIRMTLRRNNHYIPQMYLSRWANNGRILVYRLYVSHDKVPLWSKQSIEHTASLSNLYINVYKDEEYDTLEHDFSTRFESPAKIPIDKICDGEKMTSQDWRAICDYVVAQYVRTPAFYIWVKQWGAEHIPEQIDQLGKELTEIKEFPIIKNDIRTDASLLPISAHVLDEKPDDKHTYIEISAVSGKGLWLFVIKHLLQESSVLRKHFRDLKWSVISAPEGECWITCDNPVVLCNINDNVIKCATLSEGIIGREKAVIFPISPRKVLLAMHSRVYPWRFQADTIMSNMIRTAIIENAMLYVYSNNEDKGVASIRSRTVDEQKYKRIKNDFETWFDNYKEIEGPLLNR